MYWRIVDGLSWRFIQEKNIVAKQLATVSTVVLAFDDSGLRLFTDVPAIQEYNLHLFDCE
jgi:hypothetical protein